MVLHSYKFGSAGRVKADRAFVFSIMSAFAIMMLFALTYLYASTQVQQSQQFIESGYLASAGSAAAYDAFNLSAISVQRTNTTYQISESYWRGKNTTLANRLTAYNNLEQLMASTSFFNTTYDWSGLNFSAFGLSGTNFNYSWNYPSELLTLAGTFTQLNISFNNSASSITSNCTGGGATAVNVRSGAATYSISPSATCTINVSYSGTILPISFNGATYALNYSALTFNTTQNVSAVVAATSPMRFIGTSYSVITTSTTNPGWTEPTYPAGVTSKHFGNATIAGANRNVIIIDVTGGIALAYIDTNNNGVFTDSVDWQLAQNKSNVALNNDIFRLAIASNDQSIIFENVFGIYIKKGDNTLIRTW